MKKTIYTLMAVSILLSSCTKKYCWICTTYTPTIVHQQTTIVQTKNTVCDKTTTEIKDVEKSGTIDLSSGNNTSKIITTCTQQR